MQIERIDEVLVEADELLGKLLLVGDCRFALSEANTDRLLNKDHVREVGLRRDQSFVLNVATTALTHV